MTTFPSPEFASPSSDLAPNSDAQHSESGPLHSELDPGPELRPSSLPQLFDHLPSPSSPSNSAGPVPSPSLPSDQSVASDTTGLYSNTVTRGINWIFAITVIAFHLGAIAAIFYFRWSALLVFFGVWIVSQNIGIAMGYHRLLTHRGYAVPKWLEYAITTGATLALQGGPIYWVAVHRMHHKYTDKSGDPHSPRDGRWWSHMGWILNGSLRNESAVLKQYAPDLARDRYYAWLNKYHWLPLVVLGGVLFAFGGWSWLLWGTILPVTIGFHVTWMVNSVTHIWGGQRFSTGDDSRNNFWVAILTGGEGWHNNHHAFPVSARHGLAWYEVDFNYYGIWILKRLGLARNVKTASVKAPAASNPQ